MKEKDYSDKNHQHEHQLFLEVEYKLLMSKEHRNLLSEINGQFNLIRVVSIFKVLVQKLDSIFVTSFHQKLTFYQVIIYILGHILP